MDYSKFVPQILLLLPLTFVLVNDIIVYGKEPSLKNEAHLKSIIIATAYLLLMLVWGGFFTPISKW